MEYGKRGVACAMKKRESGDLKKIFETLGFGVMMILMIALACFLILLLIINII